MNSLQCAAPQQPSGADMALDIFWIGKCSVPLSVDKLATLCWAPEHAHKLKALREKSSHCNFKQQVRVLR